MCRCCSTRASTYVASRSSTRPRRRSARFSGAAWTRSSSERPSCSRTKRSRHEGSPKRCGGRVDHRRAVQVFVGAPPLVARTVCRDAAAGGGRVAGRRGHGHRSVHLHAVLTSSPPAPRRAVAVAGLVALLLVGVVGALAVAEIGLRLAHFHY